LGGKIRMIYVFFNRTEAGEKLGKLLVKKYKNNKTIVYGLPRGGVVTAFEVAKKLNCPLRLCITRKIGYPLEPEFAIAAISQHGHIIYETSYVNKINKTWLEKEIARQKEEIRRRKLTYDTQEAFGFLEQKSVILVDDGVATGLTIRAAIADVKDLHPKKIVIATPVISQEIASLLKREVDEIIAIEIPKKFLGGISAYYQQFPQVSDAEVIMIMKQAALL